MTTSEITFKWLCDCLWLLLVEFLTFRSNLSQGWCFLSLFSRSLFHFPFLSVRLPFMQRRCNHTFDKSAVIVLSLFRNNDEKSTLLMYCSWSSFPDQTRQRSNTCMQLTIYYRKKEVHFINSIIWCLLCVLRSNLIGRCVWLPYSTMRCDAMRFDVMRFIQYISSEWHIRCSIYRCMANRVISLWNFLIWQHLIAFELISSDYGTKTHGYIEAIAIVDYSNLRIDRKINSTPQKM